MVQLRRRFSLGAVSATALRSLYESYLHERGSGHSGLLTILIDRQDISWTLDRFEDFFEELSDGPCRALLADEEGESLFELRIDGAGTVELIVRLHAVEQVRRVVQPLHGIPVDPRFTVFVAHGRDPQWQVLVDHLRDRHGFHVITYETLAEYGQPATHVLDAAARTANVALLVHTAELKTADGLRYPVSNVAHETGFFAAHLGSHRALVLREDSCRPFTNIAGQTELRFSDGNIREIFGDVVAELRRQEKNAAPTRPDCATMPSCPYQHPRP